jgi:hypothetical protein
LWGIISRRVANESGLLDPEDVISTISSELSKPTIKDWIGARTRVSVKKLNVTRSWRSHLPEAGVKLEGGLLKDESGNHLFLCMQRRGARVKPIQTNQKQILSTMFLKYTFFCSTVWGSQCTTGLPNTPLCWGS